MGIYTRKPVDHLIGHRVWLISGQGRPRTYELVGSFRVEKIGKNPDGTNFARGETVAAFKPSIPIGEMDWFALLKRATNSFSFGLTRLKDEAVVSGLLAVSPGNNSPAMLPKLPNAHGGLFGTPAESAVVEEAAIEAASRHYRAEGWQVFSQEPLNLGYDLLCTRADEIRHVEVKGVRGSECSFILTANERDFAERNESFYLCVVVSALDPACRKINEFTAAEMNSRFIFKPVSFVARLKA
jgi:hypothetical protein